MNTYGTERLVRLLRLLRPAPQAWIGKAQRTLQEMLAQDRSAGVRHGGGLAESQLTELAQVLERDPRFRKSFDEDPVAAAKAAGWTTLARTLEWEIDQLLAVAERITKDASYRNELLEDPLARLERSGVPSLAGERLLLSLPLDVPTGVPDVVAHQQGTGSSRERLLILLLGSSAVAAKLGGLGRDTA